MRARRRGGGRGRDGRDSERGTCHRTSAARYWKISAGGGANTPPLSQMLSHLAHDTPEAVSLARRARGSVLVDWRVDWRVPVAVITVVLVVAALADVWLQQGPGHQTRGINHR